MMKRLAAGLVGWKGYALAAALSAAVAGGMGFGLAWKLQEGQIARLERNYAKEREAAAKAGLKAVAQARKEERQAAEISDAIGRRAAEAQAQIRTVYRDIIREVPKYVSASSDARCIVPVGFVRTHTAAGRGVPIAEARDSAGRADDAPSGVALSEVAAVDVQWAELYHSVARQLNDLIDWNEAQERLAEKRPDG